MISKTIRISDQAMHELQHLAGTMAVARNAIRAGGRSDSRLTNRPGAPRLQDVLDQGCERFANLLADIDPKEVETKRIHG